MMKRFPSLWLLPAALLPVLSATGCATTPGTCDPTRADFFNNTRCLASGSYRQRQRDLESELAAERSRNDAFQALLADLKLEQDAVRSDLRTRQAAQARAEANWRRIKQSLAAERAKNQALNTRIGQIDRDLARAEASKRGERDALVNKVRLLEQELDAGIYD
ncbi:MAG: hypothetical protein N838_23785 [Thiohalocapsa sp. PB-PSB1]|jgi:chromosome segregation ATPase|nr:MAG: hypothetical protein N838_08870 [Thiohalocapsa sp. PB-PSB1]QQO55915.1 MAG: hypothetical protein N838_23785 [Thiohalocapsa sp. PB-PSB1]HCS91564.1 hypothetical protein [Chromatiaceae bacterium]